jgi:hypothetical protein
MANVLRHSSNRGWKDLYLAALLEGDQDKIPACIHEAERAIADRTHQLHGAQGDYRQEREDLDDAAYALHALKTCLAIHGGFAEAA